MSIHGGVSNLSQNLSPHGGVAGLDRKIVRAYAGDANGVARLVYSTGWRDKYQQVEYIQGDGASWINTGYSILSTTRMTVDYALTTTNISETAYIFGSNLGGDRFGLGVSTSGYFIFGMGNGYGRLSVNTNRHTDIFAGATHTISHDGANRTAYSGTYSSPTAGKTLGILGGQSADGSIAYGKVRMYHLTVQDLGAGQPITHDYYPVYRKSDNEPGVYDIIDGVFYSNSGSGTITVGSDYEGDL